MRIVKAIIGVVLVLGFAGAAQAAVITEDFDDADDPPVTGSLAWTESHPGNWSVETDGGGYDYQFAASGGSDFLSTGNTLTVDDRVSGTDFTISVGLTLDTATDTYPRHFWPAIGAFGYTATWLARHNGDGSHERALEIYRSGSGGTGDFSTKITCDVGTPYTLTLEGTYDGFGDLDLDFTITDGTTSVTKSRTDADPLTGITTVGLYALQHTMTVNSDFDDFQLDYTAIPVPEPATLSLLALGGLGVLIRKNKK